jgi:hypothetical protein
MAILSVNKCTCLNYFFLDKRQQVPDFKLIKPSKGSTRELLHAAAYSLAKVRKHYTVQTRPPLTGREQAQAKHLVTWQASWSVHGVEFL